MNHSKERWFNPGRTFNQLSKGEQMLSQMEKGIDSLGSSNGHLQVPITDLEFVGQAASSLDNELSRYVIGQPALVKAVIAAVFGNLKVCIIGPSGLGKTFIAWALSQILGLPSHIISMHPDVTPPELLGTVVLDLETHKKRIIHGSFTDGTTVILVIDELNRSSDRGQTGLLQPFNDGGVTIDGEFFPINDGMTVLATMNPPGSPGTRPVISALMDRFDLFVVVNSMKDSGSSHKETFNHYLSNWLNQLNDQGSVEVKSQWNPCSIAGFTPQQTIARIRQIVVKHLRDISPEVKDTISTIVTNPKFRDRKKWVNTAEARAGQAIARTATTVALMEGRVPTADDVWNTSENILIKLVPNGYEDFNENVAYIRQALKEIRYG